MADVTLTHGGSKVTIEYTNGTEAGMLLSFPEEADRWAKYYAGQLSKHDVKRVTVETVTVYEESK